MPSTGPTSLARPLSANSMGLMLKRCLPSLDLQPPSFRIPVVTDLLSQDVQYLAGHASIQTTEIYLGLQQKLNDVPCARLRWEG